MSAFDPSVLQIGGHLADEPCATARPVPVELAQRPGLAALAYRVGDHRLFKEAMLRGLVGDTPLGDLGTRRDDDFSIALVDAWAAVLDVLTFYQERVANEGYLRTALEKRSLRELARAIGYEPRPGLAAGVSLAFALEETASAPDGTVVPAGTRVQSVPGPGELPQSFETSQDLIARPEWNALTPRRWGPQRLDMESRQVWVKGAASRLKAGDPMLLVRGEETRLLAVVNTRQDPENDRTLVVMEALGSQTPPTSGNSGNDSFRILADEPAKSASLTTRKTESGSPEALRLSDSELAGLTRELREAPKGHGEMVARLHQSRFSRRQLLDALRGLRRTGGSLEGVGSGNDAGSLTREIQKRSAEVSADQGPGGSTSEANVRTFAAQGSEAGGDVGGDTDDGPSTSAVGDPVQLFALRVSTAAFGHNAPAYGTIPADWKVDEIYPVRWDGDWSLTEAAYGTTANGGGADIDAIRLAQPFQEIRPGSWLVLRSPSGTRPLRVHDANEISVTDFGLSGRSTRITLEDIDGTVFDSTAYQDLGGVFFLRDTSVYTASEELLLADQLFDRIDAGTPALDVEEAVPDLEAGRRLILCGEMLQLPGVTAHEELTLEEVTQDEGYTRLTFDRPLHEAYRLDSVSIHANVAAATHGEERRDVLGSGDAGLSFQRFPLRQAPLTYTSAPTASGAESSLEIRVDGVRWREVENFHSAGPEDRVYVLRHRVEGTGVEGSFGNAETHTEVLFGDGLRGARLPTGHENVTAVYRTGIGHAGLVEAGSISLMANRPLGVKAAVNPLASSGAEDPETVGRTRQNAPLAVLALDRVVSLQDFEDFSRAFGGIGKAQACWVWDGSRRLVHITAAGTDGQGVADEVRSNLVRALESARAHRLPFRVDGHQSLAFAVDAAVRVDPDHRREDVFERVREALARTFSFDARDFAQRVAVSEVLATIQDVEGVRAVTLDRLDYEGDALGNSADEQGLPARPARLDEATGTVVPAQLLLLLPELIQLRESDS